MLKRKGQNIAEYSILIALIIAAAVAMQVYVKRGMQGRIADAVDYNPTVSPDQYTTYNWETKQYEPYYLDANAVVSSDRTYQETLGNRGQTQRAGLDEETRREVGSYERQKGADQLDRGE
jgi:hypothetical protein